MCRVIFGAGPSPFLLCRTVNYHLKKYQDTYRSRICRKIRDEFVCRYVDDAIVGCVSVEDAIQMFEKAKTSFKEGGFLLRKWKSRNQENSQMDKEIGRERRFARTAPQA